MSLIIIIYRKKVGHITLSCCGGFKFGQFKVKMIIFNYFILFFFLTTSLRRRQMACDPRNYKAMIFFNDKRYNTKVAQLRVGSHSESEVSVKDIIRSIFHYNS